MDAREMLLKEIEESAGNTIYTYVAHWAIVDRLEKRNTVIKIVVILLTALSAGGFFVSLLSKHSELSWIGALTSTIALGFNLYTLNFDLPELCKLHTEAANELWLVRERYKSLLVDFEDMDSVSIRIKRDELSELVDSINRKYPGTDRASFKYAQKNLSKYEFSDFEIKELLHM